MTSEVAILRAYALLMQGAHEEAILFLEKVPEVLQTPSGVDLLARIYFEQGELEKAKVLWEKLRLSAPDFEPAIKALEAYASPHSTQSASFGRNAWICVGILAALLFLVTSVAFFVKPNPSSASQPQAMERICCEEIILPYTLPLSSALIGDRISEILKDKTIRCDFLISGGDGSVKKRRNQLLVLEEVLAGEFPNACIYSDISAERESGFCIRIIFTQALALEGD